MQGRLDLTHAEISALFGVDESTMHRWKRKRGPFRLPQRAAELLEVISEAADSIDREVLRKEFMVNGPLRGALFTIISAYRRLKEV